LTIFPVVARGNANGYNYTRNANGELMMYDVHQWMACNSLKLNDDKTELIVLGTPQKLSLVNNPRVKIGDCYVSASNEVKNIGAIFTL